MLENNIYSQQSEHNRADVLNLRQGIAKKRCPICDRLFKSSKTKSVFCDYCREYSESYKFSD